MQIIVLQLQQQLSKELLLECRTIVKGTHMTWTAMLDYGWRLGVVGSCSPEDDLDCGSGGCARHT